MTLGGDSLRVRADLGRLGFQLLFHRGLALRGFTQECPGGKTQARDQRQRHGTGGGEGQLVTFYRFLESIRRARWTGEDGVVIEVSLNVTCEAVRGFVALSAIF